MVFLFLFLSFFLLKYSTCIRTKMVLLHLLRDVCKTIWMLWAYVRFSYYFGAEMLAITEQKCVCNKTLNTIFICISIESNWSLFYIAFTLGRNIILITPICVSRQWDMVWCLCAIWFVPQNDGTMCTIMKRTMMKKKKKKKYIGQVDLTFMDIKRQTEKRIEKR